MEGIELIVNTSFWAAFILDILILFYALNISARLGGGFLGNVIKLVGISAFVFGLHHILEIFFAASEIGIAVAEGVEGVAAIVLVAGVYNLSRSG